MTYGVGVVGIGFGQQAHVPAFRLDPRCEVVAICASQIQRAEQVAQRLAIRAAYADWRALVEDPAVDIVTIAVPPTLQAVIAEAAIDAGKAIFCEKPVANDAASAGALLAKAQAGRRAHVVNFEFCELACWRKLSAELRAGTIGEVRHASLSWHVEQYAQRHRLTSWKTMVAEGGGPLNSLAAHSLHYLEWLFGPIDTVAAELHPRQGERVGDELWISLLSTTCSGVAITASISCVSPVGDGHRLLISGTDGALRLANDTSDYMLGFALSRRRRGDRDWVELIHERDATDAAAGDGRIAPVSRLARKLTDWCADGRPRGPNLRHGYRVQYLLECVRKSAATSSSVAVLPSGLEL